MSTSPRVATTLEHAGARRSREQRALRRLSVPLLLVIAIPAFSADPAASLHGTGLAVTLALVGILGSFAVIRIRGAQLDRRGGALAPSVIALVVLAASGVALVLAQPAGTGALVLSLVAYVAGARLPPRSGIATVAAAAMATAVALAARASAPVTAISTSVLLAVLLAPATGPRPSVTRSITV